MGVHIANGRIIDPANQVDDVQDLFIEDDCIAGYGTAPSGFTADHIIDATDKIVIPGLVDLRSHLREPGQEQKATIASETQAAVCAGITTLCCTPDTNPVIDSPAVATLIRQRAETAGKARVVPLGALTQKLDGNHLSEMSALKDAGCVGVSNVMKPIANTLIMRRAMEYAATHDLTVFINAEDPYLKNDGSAHEGSVATRLGLPGIPEAAETVAVASALALVGQIGVRVHFSLLSTLRAVQIVARAQHDGLPVTADVSAHHLHLTEIDIIEFDSLCHVQPPLRTQRDLEALRNGVKNGSLSAICSDHQPHEPDAKLAPFSATAPGISALETLLPLSLRLTDNNFMSLNDIIARLTCMPAKILGINSGTLSIGTKADICIYDPEKYWTLEKNTMVSRGHNSPFIGWEHKGQVTHTLLNGRLVFER